MQIFNFNSKTTKKFFVTAVYDNKKATNKGAVEASDANSTTTKKEDSEGILSKGSEVLGEGWKNIVDAVEKALTATSVNPTTIPGTDGKPCFCNRDFEEKDVREFVKLLKGSKTIWN